MLQQCEHIPSVFKSIQKSLLQLILKDNNDSVRNAAVCVVIEIGVFMINDEAFQTQIQSLIVQLPKSRIIEINKKLQPQEAVVIQEPLSKTMAQPKSTKMEETQPEDEFSKTLAPAKQQIQGLPGQFYQTLMKLIRTLPSNTQSKIQLQGTFQEALGQEETVKILVKNRILISKAFADCLSQQAKALSSQKEQVLQIVELIKELYMSDITEGVQTPVDELKDFISVGLLLTEVGVEQETGVTSSILVLGMESSQDQLNFLEMMRSVLETPQIMNTQHAIKIISNVYLWLGLKLQDFVRGGMNFSDIEELRGLGIKYLESTHLFNEKQRQQLISVMIRFKDQISEVRTEALQTLGQVLPSARSLQSSMMDTKQQTAQFNNGDIQVLQQSQQPITAELICQTIDKEFEQGLLMFKELAQSNQGLDFETKEMIFNKLLGIVSEGCFQNSQSSHNPQQQQYRQAYALKALMWMKEETMGLEDTYKLTTPILQVYLMQIGREIDASVELYLLNFWVRELSTRDLCDRIQNTVSQVKAVSRMSNKRQAHQCSEEQLDAFRILFQWLSEHKLDPSPTEWKMSDLRKIALLICESVLSKQSKAKELCYIFLKQCVAKDSSEKVLEFMEIQLMHSNEVFLQFLDWFQTQFPSKKSITPVDVNKASISTMSEQQQQISERSNNPDVSLQHQSYVERRQQMKQSQLAKNEQSEKQARDAILKIEDESMQQQSLMQEINKQPSRQEIMNDASHQQSLMQEVVKPPSRQGGGMSSGGEPRRSRYDDNNRDKQFFDSIDNEDDSGDEVLPIEEVKEAPQRVMSAATKQRQNSELQEKVQQSEAKQRDWVSKIIQLENEKRRIEEETSMLKQQNNQESKAWQSKLAEMQNEHLEVNANLSEVNHCYLQQVDENEKLKVQLLQMQRQHEDMMTRFEQIERKINSREETSRTIAQAQLMDAPNTPPRNESRRREPIMNSVAKLQRISDTFCVSDQQIGIHKICELLLSVERNVDGELAKPLISHYQRFRTVDERLSMITALGEALNLNEDVLLALSVDVYKALLNFLLRAFAHEKERLDTQSMGGRDKQEQNQVTMESQKLVSRLLNSKDFTASLVSLFQLLREAMPEDLNPVLPIEEGQYLRVLMRCINRITKALHSESSDLIRGFDVLLEMQKIFLICPPENLREDLPSLADFDFVFRGMKDVSDKFIDLQPEKVQSFLGYCEVKKQPENAFMKYLRMKSQ